MAATQFPDVLRGFNQLDGRSKVGLMLGLAALFALAVGSWLWSANPEYRVLYANVADRDGGAIVTALNQLNVPYRVAEGGNTIMVPARQVHDTRLRLASQGLPRGGVVGFELMETQKLGATQFQEQVNYQRALEGELARSIQTLSAVASARVHLAIPKPSVFLRDQQKPSASVIVNLHSGRSLDRGQVAGIAHLVSSSVAELQTRAVSVLDQNGTLLSAPQEQNGAATLDGSQLAYVQGIETSTIKRVSDILEPILGRANLRVQVTAEVDFSRSESTAETYNQAPQAGVMRSEQRSESSEPAAAGAQGVAGAASNQPFAQAVQSQPQPQAAATKKDSTVNYEVDKTIRHIKGPVGSVKRLSAAVVVNYRKGQPIAEPEMAQIASLAKEAMGYTQTRGDTISVANAPFSVEEQKSVPVEEPPLWKQPETVSIAMDAGRMLLAAIVVLYILLGILRPVLRNLSEAPRHEPVAMLEHAPEDGAAPAHAQRLAAARQIAKSDPKVVANVVKTWVAADE